MEMRHTSTSTAEPQSLHQQCEVLPIAPNVLDITLEPSSPLLLTTLLLLTLNDASVMQFGACLPSIVIFNTRIQGPATMDQVKD